MSNVKEELIREIGRAIFYQGSPSKICLQHAEILADTILAREKRIVDSIVEPLEKEVNRVRQLKHYPENNTKGYGNAIDEAIKRAKELTQ